MQSEEMLESRNPFDGDEGEDLDTSERSWNLPLVLPEIPNSPPPPPPTSPKSLYSPQLSTIPDVAPTIVKLPEKSPRKAANFDVGELKQHENGDKPTSSSKSRSNKDKSKSGGGGGKKKRRKGKRTKKTSISDNPSNTRPPRGSNGKQYSSMANSKYRLDDKNGLPKTAPPRIVNYPSPKQNTGKKNIGNFFSSLFTDGSQNEKTPSKPKKKIIEQYEGEYGYDTEDPSYIRNGTYYHSTRSINTGELNSALGEGTTIPEVLDRSRTIHILHILAVFVLEGSAFFWHVLTLQVKSVLLAAGLVFLSVLLGCYEAVRGIPTLTYRHPSNHATRFGTALPAAEVVMYKLVLGNKRERIRNFLQKYVGILYSCVGRGLYLCMMGGLAWAHHTLFMYILGLSFGVLGIWTISLRCRYPDLEKIYKEQKTAMRDGMDDDASAGGSTVTWSSVPSNFEPEGQPLLP